MLTDVRVEKLDVGDYACEYKDGSKCPIIFERKSGSDLWGTMTQGYTRFKRELDRAKKANVKLVLAIEGTPESVWAGFERSQFTGESMIKKLMTMWIKYDLMPMFFETRRGMADTIVEFYEAFGRLYKS